MSFIARLAGVASVILLAALSVGASSSHALVEEAYLAAAQEDALWYRASVTGTAWPDTFPASWAAPSAHKVSVAAKALPALRAVGTLWLGATAFEVGWKIGRTIDTKWLHLSGEIGTDSTAAANVRWRFGQWCGVCPEAWTLIPDMTHWSKTTTRLFSDGNSEFEIHFYRHIPTNTVRFDVDFKIRFQYTPDP